MKKWIWIGLAVVAITVIVYFVTKKRSNDRSYEDMKYTPLVQKSGSSIDDVALNAPYLRSLEEKHDNGIPLSPREMRDLATLQQAEMDATVARRG